MKGVIYVTLFSISAVCAHFDINVDDFNSKQEVSTSYNLATLVKKYGYPFEKKSVITKDGYKLEIHRVQYSPTSDNSDSRPPVLIMHGLLGCSADFFHIGPGKSLPLRLADEGYDVWLGNNRGNSYSRKHTTLNPDKNETFWDFSLDEIGTLDTTAIIDFILNTTNKETLSYVGHSTGATQFFIMAAAKPEYNKKVNVMASLAPVVFMGHTSSIILDIVTKSDYAAILAEEKAHNMTELLAHDFIFDVAFGLICKDAGLEICALLMFLITGFDTAELNMTNVPEFFKSFPAGISVKELNHVLQFKISDEFRKYDYGKIENMVIYKNISPPSYDLTQVSTPVALYYGQNDLIVSVEDIEHLALDLPKVIDKHLIEYKEFNHIDFLLANDVDYFLNYYIINTLNKYNDLPDIVSSTTKRTTTTARTTASTSPTPETTAPTTSHTPESTTPDDRPETTTSTSDTTTSTGEPYSTTSGSNSVTVPISVATFISLYFIIQLLY